MVDLNVQEMLRWYRSYVGAIDADYYDSEAWLALGIRDRIQGRIAELSADECAELAAIDDELMEKRDLVVEIGPSGAPQDRSHWWWFLHEGPQVREEAEHAAIDTRA